MKHWFGKNWFKLALLVILLAAVGGGFYWYSYKPAQLRSHCTQECVYSASCGGLPHYDANDRPSPSDYQWCDVEFFQTSPPPFPTQDSCIASCIAVHENG